MDTFFATELLLSIGSIGVLSWKIAGMPQLDGPAAAATEPPADSAPAMPEVPAPDFTRLRWALTSEQVPVRLAAVAELSVLPGQEALQLIAGLVRDADFEIRRIAVQRIAAERDPAFTDVLLQATRDVRIEVQNAACEGLVGVRDPRVTDLFRRLALQGLHYARLLGIRGLGAAGGEEKLLLEIYQSSSGKVREETVVALAASRDPAALQAVREHLKLRMEQGPAQQKSEPVDEVQFRQLLEQEPSVGLIEEMETGLRDLPPTRRKGEVLARLGALARDAGADERRRYMAVRAIGFLGGQPVLDQLVSLAQDSVTAVRFASTIAIGKLRTAKAMDAMRHSLGDASFLVRAGAVVFLDQMGNSVERSVFEAAAQDSDALVRTVARKALEARPVPPSRLGALAAAVKPAPTAGIVPPAPAAPEARATVARPKTIAPSSRSDKALETLLKPLRHASMTRPPTSARASSDRKKLTLSEVLRRA